jgi:hypothetical protein
MPKQVKDPEKTTPGDEGNAPKTAEVDVSALVEGFGTVVTEALKGVAAQPAAPTPDPTPDPKARLAEAQEKYESHRRKANELAAEGDAAGATEEMYKGFVELQSASAVPVTETPQAKALLASAKRTARSDHKEMFDDYGSEIEAEVAAMPVEERINPDSWDAAVSRVKARHIEDIIERRTQTAADEAAQKAQDSADFDTPVAGGARRRRVRDVADVDPSSLNEEQLDIASACGLSPEEYADAATRYAKAPRNYRGNVPILDETESPKIAPGKF